MAPILSDLENRMEIAIALKLHLLAVVVWVGGMFFAWMCLRPVAGVLLEPPERLRLWVGVFEQFFPWVWAAVPIILGTGLWLMKARYGAMGDAPLFVDAMFGLGVLMMLIFMHVFFAPYRRLRIAVMNQDWPTGGRSLAQIRKLVATNMLLGLVTVAVAAGGYLVAL
jgi:uncharacterized membrane protein